MGIKVRVIAAQGATLRGPAVLRLSEAQHSLRSHVLGPYKKGAPVKLDGGSEISLKYGEEFAIEDGEGRLNTALFADITPDRKKLKPGESGQDTQAGGAS